MTAQSATVEFDRAGNHLTAYVSGELDAAAASAILRTVAAQVRAEDGLVGLDLSTCAFCDSSGMVLFFKLHDLVRSHGGRFVIFSPTPPVRRVIDRCDPGNVLAVRT